MGELKAQLDIHQPTLSQQLGVLRSQGVVVTPGASLAGGLVIGIAAAMFLLLNGRIAGISGVLGGLVKPVRGDISWRVAFVAGLLGAPLLYALVAELPRPQIDAGYAGLVVAGLLVGGGLLFGIGWGIAGFCPGPALVALGMGEQKALVFVAAMLVGMGLFELLERRQAMRSTPT